MSESLFVPSFKMDAHGNLSKSSCLNMNALEKARMKTAYLLNGPQKLRWDLVDELRNLPENTAWVGLDDPSQSELTSEQWGADLDYFLQNVMDASRTHDNLVIYHANIETGKHWTEFALKSGLIASGFRCIILSRWISDWTVSDWIVYSGLLPVGNWEIQLPLPDGWDSPASSAPTTLHRLPGTPDKYYLPAGHK